MAANGASSFAATDIPVIQQLNQQLLEAGEVHRRAVTNSHDYDPMTSANLIRDAITDNGSAMLQRRAEMQRNMPLPVDAIIGGDPFLSHLPHVVQNVTSQGTTYNRTYAEAAMDDTMDQHFLKMQRR